MSQYVFVNITENHFKVWGYDWFSNTQNSENELIAYYGRIGLPMQHLNKHRKTFACWYDARMYIKKKIDEKICKGYVALPNSMYFQMIQSPRGIAALIGIIKKMESVYMTYYNCKELKKAV